MEDETGRDYADMRKLVVEAIMREIDNG